MNGLNHVAIIMDGNGRWGLKKKNSRNYGHLKGLKTVEIAIKASIKKKIPFLTLYTFSTENWKRPKKEINFLLGLLENYLLKKTKDLNSNGGKFKSIGSKKLFSKKLLKILKNSQTIKKKNKKLQLNLALNYGSKNELINAVNAIKKKKLFNSIKY